MRIFFAIILTALFLITVHADDQEQSEEFRTAMTAIDSLKHEKTKANWDTAKKAVRNLREKLDNALLKNNQGPTPGKEALQKLEKESTLQEAVEYRNARGELGKLLEDSILSSEKSVRTTVKTRTSIRNQEDISVDGLFSNPKASTEKDFRLLAAKCIKSWISVDNPNVPENKINEITEILVTGQDTEKAENMLQEILKSAPQGPCDFIKSLMVLTKMRKGHSNYNNYGSSLDAIILNGQIEEAEAQVVFRWMDNYNYRKFWVDFGNNIRSSTIVDPWLKNMLLAKSEINAGWQARNTKLPGTTQESRAKEHRKHFQNAKELLSSAYNMHPERPEAAVMMLTVEKGFDDNPQTCLEWFRKATDAQVDYDEAFLHFEGVMIHQQNSEENLRRLAAACLDAKLRNRTIQKMGLGALLLASSSSAQNKWQSVYREPEFHKKILSFTDELAASPETKDMASVILICLNTALGNYDEADRMLREMPPEKFNTVFKELAGSETAFDAGALLNRSIDYPAFLKTFTGPEKESFRQIQEDLLQNKTNVDKKVLELIKSGKLNAEDKKFAADFYGKIKMGNMSSAYFCNYRTALNTAIAFNNTRVAEELLDLGADPNKSDWYGNSSLVIAARNNLNPALLAKLKTAGANINSPGVYGNTPLHDAIRSGNTEVLKQLINLGADLNTINNYKATPLFMTIYYNRPEMLKILLDTEADVNIRDQYGMTLLRQAIHSEIPVEIIGKIIGKGADINATDKNGFTALHWASLKPKKEVIELLLKNGADVNARTKFGETPLLVAMRNKCGLETVKLFANAGADLKAKDKQGRNAIKYARQNKANDIIKYLEENK